MLTYYLQLVVRVAGTGDQFRDEVRMFLHDKAGGFGLSRQWHASMRLPRTTVRRQMVHVVRLGSRRVGRRLAEPFCDRVRALTPPIRWSRSRARCARARSVGHATATGLQFRQLHALRRRRCGLVLPRRRRLRLQRELDRLVNLAARRGLLSDSSQALDNAPKGVGGGAAPAVAPSRRRTHPRKIYSRSRTCSCPHPPRAPAAPSVCFPPTPPDVWDGLSGLNMQY